MNVELMQDTGDLLVLNAARASYNRTAENFTESQNQGLLNFLARAEPAHFVPYTHVRLKFQCHRTQVRWDKLKMEHWAGIETEWDGDLVTITNSLWGWKELIEQDLVGYSFSNTVKHTINVKKNLRGSAVALGIDTYPSKANSVGKYLGEATKYTLRITCPILVARQFVKTSVGVSISEASGRYILYTSMGRPTQWLEKPENSKQGSGAPLGKFKQKLANTLLSAGYWLSNTIYNTLLKLSVAPEQARFIMPMGTNTTFVVTFTPDALRRFLELRLEGTAQTEIRELAQKIKEVTNL